MYQLDLGYWRFSAAFPVHSEIGGDHNILIENQVCYNSQCEEPPVIKALLVLRGKQFLFIILPPCFEPAVAPPLHPSAEKIRGSLPLFAPANIDPSHVSTNFLLHHLFRGLSISVNISATNASYLQLRGYAVKEGLLISKLVIVECLSGWRQFSKQFGGCWSMSSCFGKSGSPDG